MIEAGFELMNNLMFLALIMYVGLIAIVSMTIKILVLELSKLIIKIKGILLESQMKQISFAFNKFFQKN